MGASNNEEDIADFPYLIMPNQLYGFEKQLTRIPSARVLIFDMHNILYWLALELFRLGKGMLAYHD